MTKREEFKKYDSEKPDLSLFPSILMEAFCTVGTHGAKKYGRYNYRQAKLEDIPRYHAAFLRHYFGYKDSDGIVHGFVRGNLSDKDSGLNELWQAYWNISAILEAADELGYEEVSKILRGK